MAPKVVPSGFFALRTPLMPHDALTRHVDGLRAPIALAEGGDLSAALAEDRERLVAELRAELKDPVVREALFVASPSLDEAIDAWLADPSSPRARGVVDILVRYLARMAARPTPFGLFSGCSVGTLGARTTLELAPRSSYRRNTRLDTHYLWGLCDALHRDAVIRHGLAFRPSSGLYQAAGHYRFAEARSDPKSRALSHHLVSVERTDYLDATLLRAGHGARPDELAAALVARDPDITYEEALAYIDELIEGQILVSQLAPSVTDDEPVRSIVSTLAGSSEGPEAAVLERVDEAVHALDDGGLGLPSSRYRAIADALARLPAKPEIARLFQVDLYKPAAKAELGFEVLEEIERAAALLARVVPSAEHWGLKRFREALLDRYGAKLDGPLSESSTVPLVEVLDEEAGVGFPSAFGEGGTEPSPLLDGLALPPDPAAPRVAFGRREHHLLRRLSEAQRARSKEWVLDEADLTLLAPSTPTELPPAFAMAVTLAATSPAALARGDFRLLVHALSGPSGARLLGRFCHGDPALRRAVEAHLRAEEAARPDAIFAEIVHLPEGRLGNVLRRPALRHHEIPYLGRSGVAEEQRIHVTDLRVGLSRGRLLLYSARHERVVVPRLTSAHNYERSALAIYRFLGALQQEGHSGGVVWTWGPLESAPFLPRVSHGRIVLSSARWNLAQDQLTPLGKGAEVERYRAVQRLREELGLPRWVGVADGDNVLPVDLDNALHVDSFVRLVKTRRSVSLLELFAEEGLIVEGPEGRFVHELVVPFVKEQKAEPSRPYGPAPTARVPTTFLPGSEWLYAKLFAGTDGADDVLQEVVAPLIEAARAAGARNWFFLRHGDPQWHVRLRVRGAGSTLDSSLLPALCAAAAPLLRDGRLWKLQLDTYEREVGRYGGPEAIELAESIFEADSDAVLAILQLLDGDEGADQRWRLALRGMHVLLVDLGLDLPRRTAVLRQIRAGHGAEHRVDVYVEKHLAEKYRAERVALEALLTTPVGGGHPLDRGFEALAQESEKIRPIARELAARESQGRLTSTLDELAPSFLHMHANRLLRAEQRAQELVLSDFLLRLYESEGARARHPR